MERTSIEDPIHRAYDGPSVGRDRCQREQAHSREPLGDLLGIQPSLWSVDAKQVCAGSLVAIVEELLQRCDVSS